MQPYSANHQFNNCKAGIGPLHCDDSSEVNVVVKANDVKQRLVNLYFDYTKDCKTVELTIDLLKKKTTCFVGAVFKDVEVSAVPIIDIKNCGR